jgi:hypothetical protein
MAIEVEDVIRLAIPSREVKFFAQRRERRRVEYMDTD